MTAERSQWWELQEALTLIQRIAAGDFSGWNGAVAAAQDFLTTRTKALALIEGEGVTPCTCTIACIPQGKSDEQTCRMGDLDA